MPKIVVESGMVFNLGGYIIERTAKLPCVDVIIGNPLAEDVKLKAPAYSEADIEEYKKAGMIVEYLNEGDRLKEVMEKVRAEVVKSLGEAK